VSLVTRLFLVLAIVAAPAIAAQLYAAKEFAQERERKAHAAVASWTNFAAGEMELILEGARGMLAAIAASPTIRGKDVGLCQPFLAEVSKAHPLFGLLGVIDADGQSLCTASPTSPKVYIGDRPYFRKAMESDSLVVGPPITGRVSNSLALPIALRFNRLDGSPGGVVFAPLQIDGLIEHFRLKPLPPNSSISLIDRDGTVILRLPQTELSGARISPVREWMLAVDGPGTVDSPAAQSPDQISRILGYTPLSRTTRNLIVAVGIERNQAFADSAETAAVGIVAIAVALALIFLAAWLGARYYIDRPIRLLDEAAGKWRSGDVQARVDEDLARGEIGRLAVAFNAMAAAIATREHERDQMISQLRILVGELNHRTKNSLAAVYAMMRQTARSRTTLDEFLPAFERRLTAYLRAHELLHESNWQSTSLKSLAAAVVAPYVSEQVERFELVGEDAALSPQTALALALAFGELATNAAKYGAFSTESGRVRLDAKFSSLPGNVRPSHNGHPSQRRLILTWTEFRGPSVANPAHSGFGSRLLNQLAESLSGEIELRFNQLGVVCEISFPHAA
jgi:two-component sensor histidine kinase